MPMQRQDALENEEMVYLVWAEGSPSQLESALLRGQNGWSESFL